MATEILMPALSPTMTEGKLSKWLKKVGDEVKSGDVIAEIETDKATMEVEAVDEGKILQILVEEGSEGVAVNTVIATLGGQGESAAAPNRQRHRRPRRRQQNQRRRKPRHLLKSPRSQRLRRRRNWPNLNGARPGRSRCARRCARR